MSRRARNAMHAAARAFRFAADHLDEAAIWLLDRANRKAQERGEHR